MRRVTMLREQARLLRDMAARSTGHPEIYERLLALALQCDTLAEAVGETLSRAPGQPTEPARKPH
jgi:hypothetical protein